VAQPGLTFMLKNGVKYADPQEKCMCSWGGWGFEIALGAKMPNLANMLTTQVCRLPWRSRSSFNQNK
jgi:hypothetical protein